MQKYHPILIVSFCLCLVQFPTSIRAQIIAGDTEIKLHSANPVIDFGKTEKDMNFIDFRLFFNGLHPELKRSGGIMADEFGANGKAELSVYLYDEKSKDGKGALIYQTFNTKASKDFEQQNSVIIEGTDALSKQKITYPSTDMFRAITTKNIYRENCPNMSTELTTVGQRAIAYGVAGVVTCGIVCALAVGASWLTGGISTSLCVICAGAAVTMEYAILSGGEPSIKTMEDYTCAKNYSPIRPVIIEVSLKNVRLNQIKAPVLAGIEADKVFNLPNKVRVTVSINGVDQPPLEKDSPPPTYDLTMGDEVSFKVECDKAIVPRIYGVPEVIPLQFANDAMFYCDPNVQPNGYRPFIGLDSRVHTLMLRSYPEGFAPRVADWNPKGEKSGEYFVYKWKWTAEREMDANKEKYVPSLIWPKCHLDPKRLPDGSYDMTKCKPMRGGKGEARYQRQSQKEGLNIQYLSYQKNWLTSDFQSYDGHAQFMKGFDDDELGYYNTKSPDPTKDPSMKVPCAKTDCQNDIGITKLDALPWKTTPESMSQLPNPITGFPDALGGSPLHWMVDAYRNSKGSFQSFSGYEIQDQQVDWNHPDGNGPNITNPGLVTIGVGNFPLIKMKFNVVSPLDKENDRALGFYEALVGQSAPSMAETGVRYWLRGVYNKTDEEIKKYTLVYSYMDRLGKVSEKTLNVFDDVIMPWRNSAKSWMDWVNEKSESTAQPFANTFVLERPAYSWITAYYQPKPSARKIVVAAKELTPIFLMFCGVTKLDTKPFTEGRGQAIKVFLEDFRSKKYGDYTEARKFGTLTKYTSKYGKEYVFNIHDRARFTTWDGDPWMFDNDEEEWYLGNRTMAKRVRDYLLDGSYSIDQTSGRPIHTNEKPDATNAYLKYYAKKLNPDGSESPDDYKLLTVNTIDGVDDPVRENKDLECTFSKEGYYGIKIIYRDGSDLYLRIKVTDYPDGQKASAPQSRLLTSKEAAYLGIAADKINDYALYEVKDVYSMYKYKDGYRAQVSKDPKYKNKPNRWSKYNDYADEYSWTFLSANEAEEVVPSASETKTYLDAYPKIQDKWFWNDWASHFSSNWLGVKTKSGKQGLPPYVDEKFVKRITDYEYDLDSYNSYFKNVLFDKDKHPSQLKAPWQFVIPLVSITDYYGIRGRTNPSCIYDLAKVLNATDGAFSGNPPNPPNPEDIQAPDYADDYKDQQEFFYDLKFNRKLVVDKQTEAKLLKKGTVLKVYQKNPANANEKTLVASHSSNLADDFEETP